MLSETYFKRHFKGLRLLPVATSEYEPGKVLRPQRMRIFGSVQDAAKLAGLSTDGDLAELMQVKPVPGNMVDGTIAGEADVNAGASLFGAVSIEGSVSTDLAVDWDLEDVRAKVLTGNEIMIRQLILRKLRRAAPGVWMKWDNKLVITEAYYARKFALQFHRGGQVLAKADLKKAEVDVSIEGDVSWGNDGTLSIVGNEKVPFGVRGFLI